jgi:hypothetical protein
MVRLRAARYLVEAGRGVGPFDPGGPPGWEAFLAMILGMAKAGQRGR